MGRVVSFIAGFGLAVAVLFYLASARPARAEEPAPALPTPRAHLLALAAVATEEPPAPQLPPLQTAIAPAPDTAIGRLGLPGVACWNCAPFKARARITNYYPPSGQINCYDYRADYCWSAVFIGVPWESVYNLAAACPIEWPIGTWVNVPGVGVFICLDRGGSIVCDGENICAMDILTAEVGPWNGKTLDVVLWIPLKHYQERIKSQ